VRASSNRRHKLITWRRNRKPQPPEKDQSGGQAADGRDDQALPPGGDLGQFDHFADVADCQPHHYFDAAVKEEIGQPANDPDDTGQEQMEGIFVDPDPLADFDGALEVAPDEREDTAQKIVQRSPPFNHGNNI
jgi:hypothetical protein